VLAIVVKTGSGKTTTSQLHFVPDDAEPALTVHLPHAPWGKLIDNSTNWSEAESPVSDAATKIWGFVGNQEFR